MGGKMKRPQNMQRLNLARFGISLEIPADWQGNPAEQCLVQVFAPEENNYSANLCFNLYPEEPVNQSLMQELMAGSAQQQAQTLPEFKQSRLESLEIGGQPALLREYAYRYAGPDLRLVQLQALVRAGPARLWVITASSLEELAPKYIPLIEGIIKSLTFTA
jgi:hypothetical protein